MSARRITGAVWRPSRDTDLARTETARLSSAGFSGACGTTAKSSVAINISPGKTA